MPASFHFAWYCLSTVSNPCPMRSSGNSVTQKIACFQTRTVLGFENVGDYELVAHCFCYPATRSVEHRTGIARAIGAETVNLTGETIVQSSAYWSSTDCTTYESVTFVQTHTELTTDCWLVVAVVLFNKITRRPESDRLNLHSITSQNIATVLVIGRTAFFIGLDKVGDISHSLDLLTGCSNILSTSHPR